MKVILEIWDERRGVGPSGGGDDLSSFPSSWLCPPPGTSNKSLKLSLETRKRRLFVEMSAELYILVL